MNDKLTHLIIRVHAHMGWMSLVKSRLNEQPLHEPWLLMQASTFGFKIVEGGLPKGDVLATARIAWYSSGQKNV